MEGGKQAVGGGLGGGGGGGGWAWRHDAMCFCTMLWSDLKQEEDIIHQILSWISNVVNNT